MMLMYIYINTTYVINTIDTINIITVTRRRNPFDKSYCKCNKTFNVFMIILWTPDVIVLCFKYVNLFYATGLFLSSWQHI